MAVALAFIFYLTLIMSSFPAGRQQCVYVEVTDGGPLLCLFLFLCWPMEPLFCFVYSILNFFLHQFPGNMTFPLFSCYVYMALIRWISHYSVATVLLGKISRYFLFKLDVFLQICNPFIYGK